MKYIVVSLAVVLSFLAGMTFSNPKYCLANCPPQIFSLSPNEFSQTLDSKKTTLIDIRTQSEYDSGHIKGAVIKDFRQPADFAFYLENLNKNQPYLIYCRTGSRSIQALEIMHKKGFKQISDLSGGIVAWQQAPDLCH